MMRTIQQGERNWDSPGYQVNGVQCPEVLLDGPEAIEFADLFSMQVDFDAVIDMCQARAAMAKDEALSAGDKVMAMRAAWEAAVITYGRAFVGGVSAVPGGGGRTRFPQEILDRLTPEQLRVHKHTVELRQKHVGHRVNNWTQVSITGVLAPDTHGGRQLLHLGSKLITVIEGGEAADQLRIVATLLRDGLSERLITLKAEIEAQLRDMPIDDLYQAAGQQQSVGAHQIRF